MFTYISNSHHHRLWVKKNKHKYNWYLPQRTTQCAPLAMVTQMWGSVVYLYLWPLQSHPLTTRPRPTFLGTAWRE